jgi:hypothetical protein
MLRSAGVALVARQGRKILSQAMAMAPDDPLVGAIRTFLDDDVSLRTLADRCIP